jgi:hypothetical protein
MYKPQNLYTDTWEGDHPQLAAEIWIFICVNLQNLDSISKMLCHLQDIN